MPGRDGSTSSALVVLGVGAAYAYSVFATIERSQQVYFDTATMVLMLFTRRQLHRGRRPRQGGARPGAAACRRERMRDASSRRAETRRPVREIGAGMLVRVRPGERVPVDGVVVEGESHTDEAVITGESRRIVKGVGSAVIAGSINLDGPLLIESSGAGTATRWAQICRSVRDALSAAARLQRVADRVVGISVPLVLVLGGLTVLYWAQLAALRRALLVGLAVLVVACPCAVGLAAPLATSLGIGRLARCGCLVRDPAALEALARARLLAFDKTGTLTSGTAASRRHRQRRARRATRCSPGPPGWSAIPSIGLARAIVDAAAERGLEPIAASDVRAVPGRGIRGSADGEPVAAGNRALMQDLGWPLVADAAERARRAGGERPFA